MDWVPDPSNPTTQFRERYVPPEENGYNPLDLYLMGMLSSSDPRLSNFYYIDNLSQVAGPLYAGNRRNLNLTSITNVHGPRVPNAAVSQRSFRQAFVLLTKDLNLGRGRPNVGVLLAEIIEQERVAHITEFRSATESRGVIDTYLYDNSYDGIYIKDNAADTGSEPTTAPFWDSPDIWVRNADDVSILHPDTYLHQDTKRFQDNFIYVRVRNSGGRPSKEITVNVFRANFAGTEFSYPEDWRWEDRLGSQVIQSVPANGEVIAKFRWDPIKIPNTTWHPCLLAEVLPIHPTHTNLRHVWQDRRIAQKNLTIVGLDDLEVLAISRRPKKLRFPFQIGARSFPNRWVRVRIHQMEGNRIPTVVLSLGREDWLSRIERLEHMSFREGDATERPRTRRARLSDLVQEGELIEQEDGSPSFAISDALRGGEIAIPLLEGERREVTLSLGGLDFGGRSPASDIRFAITQLNEQNQVVGGLDLVIKRRI
jgi:hypothetical protein